MQTDKFGVVDFVEVSITRFPGNDETNEKNNSYKNVDAQKPLTFTQSGPGVIKKYTTIYAGINRRPMVEERRAANPNDWLNLFAITVDVGLKNNNIPVDFTSLLAPQASIIKS